MQTVHELNNVVEDSGMQSVLNEPDHVTTWSGRIVKGVLYTNSLLAAGVAGYMGIVGGLDVKDDKSTNGFTGDRIVVGGIATFVCVTNFSLAFFSNRWIATKKLQDNVHDLGEVVVEKEEVVDEHMEEKLEALHATVAELTSQLTKSKTAETQLNKELAERLVELGKVNQELKKAKSALQSIDSTIDKGKDAEKELARDTSALEKFVEKEKLQNDKIHSQIDDMHSQLGNYGKQTDKLDHVNSMVGYETDALTKKIAELNQEVATITAQYLESEKNNKKLALQIQDLNSINNQLNQSIKDLKESEQMEQQLANTIDQMITHVKTRPDFDEEKHGQLLNALNEIQAQSTSK